MPADDVADLPGRLQSEVDELPTLEATFVVRNLQGGGSGNFTIHVHPKWSPKGAARFAELARDQILNNCRFFRVIDKFVAQFGIPATPQLAAAWKENYIYDDPVVASNKRGRLSFATSGPNSRTSQMFINLGDNVGLDSMRFSPFAEVTQGMDVVQRIYSGYGEGAPRGEGPNQQMIQSQGNSYLEREFPYLSWIETIEVSNSRADLDRLADYNEWFLHLSPTFRMTFAIVSVLCVGILLFAWVLGVCDLKFWNKDPLRPEAPPQRSIEEADGEELVGIISNEPQTFGRKRLQSPSTK